MLTSQRRWSRLSILGLASLLALTLSACSQDPVAVPGVTGVRLDDARVALEDAGFDNVDTVDFRGDRKPLVDGNWVVVEQDPPSETAVDPGDPVLLSILKTEDNGVVDLIPENSPVAIEITEREAESRREAEDRKRDADRQAEEKRHQDLQEIQEYVDSIDAPARLVQAGTPDLVTVAEMLRQSGRPSVETTYKVRDVKSALETYADLIDPPPLAVRANVDFIRENLVKFQRAADLLIVVSPATAEDTLNRFDELFAEARAGYNSGLSDVYAKSSLTAPAIP